MRLGLFVVSHLAQRHNIKVRLRASPYGGVQAIVLLPTTLITGIEQEQTKRSGGRLRLTSAPAAAKSENDREAPRLTAAPVVNKRPVNGDVLSRVPVQERPPAANGRPRGAHASHEPERLPRREPGNNNAPVKSGALPTGPRPVPAVPPVYTRTPDGRRELPRRVPQANLAPQLYEAPEDAKGPTAENDAERCQRVRRTMSALQQGTRRGRLAGQQQRTNDTEHHTDKDSNTP
ncbi:hypothetical protein Nans01_48900 [Nocardiopsis ansamitocini]|uniref:Uncharacterized protein n=1 Tax=Nocardiopsis ansamitocini TaxID=1670832 RepID=A0A9W6UL04_9ACTN|nr:hypothetical protein Nans01_48900 [Nocardiopsis ansamitocini]